ncbi:cyclic nucleotide-binding domain-containing protein [Magnetospira thiophila]
MVSIDGLGKLLEEHPFFTGLSDDYRTLMTGCAANERFDEGEYIGREGESANKFYLIRHGQVSLEIHAPGQGPLILETLEEGDIFGWSWLIPPHVWAYDLRAKSLCRLISLDAECLRGKCENDPALGYELYKRFIPIMAARLSAARMRLLDMYGTSK